MLNFLFFIFLPALKVKNHGILWKFCIIAKSFILYLCQDPECAIAPRDPSLLDVSNRVPMRSFCMCKVKPCRVYLIEEIITVSLGHWNHLTQKLQPFGKGPTLIFKVKSNCLLVTIWEDSKEHVTLLSYLVIIILSRRLALKSFSVKHCLVCLRYLEYYWNWGVCWIWDPCYGQSGFEGFIRDKYTALPDTQERMLATEVTSTWRYFTLLFS